MMKPRAGVIPGVTKWCPGCNGAKPVEEFHRHRNRPGGRAGICADCTSTRAVRNRQASPDRYREISRQSARREREAYPERVAAGVRRSKAALRKAVLDHYGRACQCCGSADRLTIDHVNGDGGQHRAAIGDGSATLYRWLIRNGFPDGFQTLCVPCNTSKHTQARCRLDHSERRR